MTATTSRFEREHSRDLRILSAAYASGRAPGASALGAGETVDRGVLEEGAQLRAERIVRARGTHADSGVRVFFCLWFAPEGTWWWGDLASTFTHTGIPWAWAMHDDPSLAAQLEAFRPTVTLSIAGRTFLDGPAPPALAAYKAARGCLRMALPPVPRRTEDGDLEPGERERLRRELDGAYADAHFALFVREHHAANFAEWHAAAFPYFEMPAAVNPRVHYPIGGARDLDYFIVSSPEGHRPPTAVEYLAPLMGRYFGVWAGPGWPFGEGRVAPAATPAFYARARVAPNPIHPGLVANAADITHRTFAATACGAFVLTLRTPITDRFFDDDELVAVSGAAAFIEAFDHYVVRPAERNEFVRRGLRRVFRDHTTFDRVDDFVRFVRSHADLV